MKQLRAYLLPILMLATFTVQAQVRFETRLSKTRLGVNERLRVDFEMNQDGDNFKPPGFDGFRVVGGPNQAISNSYINGKRSYSKTYSYFLSPLSRGTFTIGQATIEIDGDTYKTLPVKVEVTAAVDRPTDGNNAEYIASENVHLVAEISNLNPYLNEAITVQYRLYVSNEVNITRGWREIDSPKYVDFWSQNIDSRGNYKVYDGKYKGKDYRYVIIRTTVLYPQKSGELNLEPLVLDIPIDVETNKRDLFGRRVMTRVNKTISAGNRTINVKPLPEKGRPADFTGAVGDFDFSMTADPISLDANESLTLTIKVEGKGNLKLFELPQVSLPNALEQYEPERVDQIRTQAGGMQGNMAEAYTVIPQYKGDYPIPALSFSFFDPTTESYRTIRSDEIVLHVENGPVTAGTPVESSTGKIAVKPLSNEQFRYLKLKANLESIEKNSFFGSPLFWGLLSGPFILIPLFIFAGRRRGKLLSDVEGSRRRQADKLAKKYFSEAKRATSDQNKFYEALERALHNYLKAKLRLETSDFSKERIDELLSANNVTVQDRDGFITLLKSCELARYAPTTNAAINEDYERALNIISNLDKQL